MYTCGQSDRPTLAFTSCDVNSRQCSFVHLSHAKISLLPKEHAHPIYIYLSITYMFTVFMISTDLQDWLVLDYEEAEAAGGGVRVAP